MELKYPWFLLLYLPLVLVIFHWLKYRKEPTISVPFVKPFRDGLGKHKFFPTSRIPLIIYCTAFALLIFALARPQKGIEELKQRVEGVDIILALDLSGSMKAFDVPEDIKTSNELKDKISSGKVRSRIDVAKDEIKKFVEKRPNDRIGLVVFAPLPYMACPPTLDHSWLDRHIERLEAGMIGDSTGVAGPVSTAVNRLKDSNAKRKVIVLFTDGKNNVQARISPLQAAKLAKKFDIVLYTVGIGSPNAYILNDSGFFGQQFIQMPHEFDEKLLKEMAEETGGKYYEAKDAKGLEKTMNEINKMEKTVMEQPRFVDYRDLAFPLINAAVILLFASFILESTVFLKAP